jgi:hydrogenase maturation protease
LKVIIGYGNELRGEDGFGIEVIKKLQSYKHEDIKLISAFCLTPELVLELLEVDEVLFIDACYDVENPYTFACSILKNGSNLSHHIEPQILIALLQKVYHKEIDYSIYSMLTCNFEKIENTQKYQQCIDDLASYLRDLFH